jgi:mono/diheme cytochrome c family protein
MKNSIIYTFIILITFVLFSSNSMTENVENPDGKALYKAANCATCHGPKGKSMLNIAPSLQNAELTLAKRIKVITNGSKKEPTMIAFSPTYSKAEIEAIAKYTMTFVPKD